MHALRDGNWKYIDNTPPEGLSEDRLEKLKDFNPQLYNLKDDSGETNNLYEENPAIAKRLKEKLNQIRKADYSR